MELEKYHMNTYTNCWSNSLLRGHNEKINLLFQNSFENFKINTIYYNQVAKCNQMFFFFLIGQNFTELNIQLYFQMNYWNEHFNLLQI